MRGLDDQVDVICLYRKVHYSKVLPIPAIGIGNGATNGWKYELRPQRAQQYAQRDMHRHRIGVRWPSPMRHCPALR
jgi:hypothetical protein